MKRKVQALIPLGVFLLLAVLFAVAVLRGEEGRQPASALVGKLAPDFVLPSAYPGARHFSDDDLRGKDKPAVVNFFASWCVPCLAEHPVLMRLAEEGKVYVHGVNYKDKPRDAARWLEKHGNPYASLGRDADGRVSIDWGVYGVPETFIVDRKGIVRYRHVGPLTEEAYEKDFKKQLRKVMK